MALARRMATTGVSPTRQASKIVDVARAPMKDSDTLGDEMKRQSAAGVGRTE
jgi:hypothetical protein